LTSLNIVSKIYLLNIFLQMTVMPGNLRKNDLRRWYVIHEERTIIFLHRSLVSISYNFYAVLGFEVLGGTSGIHIRKSRHKRNFRANPTD
jgi:hypothetical protein